MSRRAISKAAVIAIVVIIIVAVVGGVYAYFALKPKPKPPIKIGVITPLSAPADYVSGHLILDTAKLFVKYQNEKGGVLGRPLELTVADQTLDAGTAISALARMVTEEHIVGLIGPWESGVALPVAEATEKYPTIMFVTYSWADEITANHYKYVFRIGVANIMVSMHQIEFIKWAGFKRVAVIYEESPYGIGQWEGYQKWRDELYPELELIGIEAPPGKTDYTAELLKVKELSPPPDLLVIHMNIPPAMIIEKQAYEMGISPGIKIMAGWCYAFLDPDSYWETVGEAGVGVIIPDYTSPYMKYTAVGEEFRKLFMDEYGKEPPVWICWYWDALRILVKAIEDTKSTDPDTLAEYIETIEIEGTTGTIKFENDPTPGSVFWHQWTGFTAYFFGLEKVGATREKQIYPPLE